MAKYVVVRTADRESVVIGRSNTENGARSIMKEDFKEWLGQKMPELPFEKAYEELEGDECELSEDSAWLNDCNGSDFDWIIIDTGTEDVLSEPLSMKQMILMTSEDDPYINGYVIVDLDEIIDGQFGDFLAILSKNLVGSTDLMDITYKLMEATEDGCAVIFVRGDVSEVLGLDDDVMFEELKSAIIKAGDSAIVDFIGTDEYDVNNTEDEIFDAFAQMPDEDLIRYYRKYCGESNQ